MMKNRLYLVTPTAVLAAAILSGCVVRERVYAPPPQPVVVQQPPPVYVPSQPPPPAPAAAPEAVPPPPPQTEVVVAPPGPGYAWTAGYWDWNGVTWIWAPGAWVLRPWRGAIWFGPHWEHRHGRAVWVRAGWR